MNTSIINALAYAPQPGDKRTFYIPTCHRISLGGAVKHKAELVICNRSLRELLFINRFSATALMPDGYLPYEGLF
jgi:hypothetical protein